MQLRPYPSACFSFCGQCAALKVHARGFEASALRAGKKLSLERSRGFASTPGVNFCSLDVEKRRPLTAEACSEACHMGSEECSSLEEYRERLQLSQACLRAVVDEFESQMGMGLHEDSNLLMIPTLVDVIPDGHEVGEIIGIELGGSRLRIVHTQLPHEMHGVDAVRISEVPVLDEQKTCSADELFDFVVQNVVSFAQSVGRDLSVMDVVTIGFCFSFPMQHLSIKSGKMIKWTKGFQNEGAIGHDPVALLKAAFRRQGVNANVEALVNDTVGVLCATRYTAGPDANVGVAMGTGTNACYVELARNIEKFKPKYFARSPEMVVNIEWPGFSSEVLPFLEEDRHLDSESDRPGDQIFEKLTAGLYMGDIARRILHRLAELEGWFGGGAQRLGESGAFKTRELALLAQDESDDLKDVASTLAGVVGCNEKDITPSVRQKAKEVCYLVTKRSAQLIAASIVGILHHIKRSQRCPIQGAPRNIIAVDGAIFTEYHLYRALLQEATAVIAGQEFADNFEIRMTDGGASFGAATLAAAGAKYERVMGRGTPPSTSQRKFPPRGKSHQDLAALR